MYDYDVIREVFNDLKKDRRKYKKELAEKTEKIKGIDSYLNSLFNKDENDSQIFLARKIESLYRDEIQMSRQEREKLVIESEHLEEYINRLNIRIDKLKKVLADSSSALHVKQSLDTSVNLLVDIIHRIESMSLYVSEDSDHTTDELNNIKKDISQVIENLKNLE